MRSLLVGLMGVFLVLGSGAIASGQILYESFDTHTPGGPPGPPWWTWGDDGTIAIDDTVYNGSSGRSVSLDRNVFPGDSFAFGRHVPPLEGQAILRYSFRITGSSREVLTVFALDDLNAMGPWLSVGIPFSGVWAYTETFDWLFVCGIDPDIWYGVAVVMDVPSNTYDILVWPEHDPSAIESLAAVPFRTEAGVGPLTSIQFGDFNISVTPDNDVAWVDDVWVVPVVFGDSFEGGDMSGWSQAVP
jgi:hypothetical protein